MAPLRIAVCLALISALFAGCTARALEERGQKIFHGEEPVVARLSGHHDPLPAQVGRCIGCHSKSQRSGVDQFAPLLTRSWLTQSHPRRGGPAFAYDRKGFCATIREGIDPGHVILLRAMPRFELNDEQCNALWAYLTGPQNDP